MTRASLILALLVTLAGCTTAEERLSTLTPPAGQHWKVMTTNDPVQDQKLLDLICQSEWEVVTESSGWYTLRRINK